ncbi:MAG: M81 family metallopeptidase [Lachnospiraceae bacterium]|jgi:microcystin degradation protein MlrC|nr:M81 family metallopeptidase [Lachnospiraceae bacterium]RKJ50734.1 M81 family peptidase [bacterium 1XD42-54]
MKVITGMFYLECNTFNPELVTKEKFIVSTGDTALTYLHVSDIFENAGFEIVPSIVASALPAGILKETDYWFFADQILETVKKEKDELAGIWLHLHGALEVENIGSGELILAKNLRELAGEHVPIAITLDAHANNAPDLNQYIDIMRGYHTIPHEDQAETERKTAEELVGLMKNKTRTRTALVTLPMILVGEKALANHEPLKQLMAEADYYETLPEVAAASIYIGNSWCDCPNTHLSVSVTPKKPENYKLAQKLCIQLAEKVFAAREKFDFEIPVMSPKTALEEAYRSHKRPVFISDTGDNTTGGAVGDSTEILRLILDMGNCKKRVLITTLYDPEAYAGCRDKQEGEAVSVRIGTGRDIFSEPVLVEGTILSKGEILGYLNCETDVSGHCVTVRNEFADVMICNVPASAISENHFKASRTPLEEYDIVILKQGYLFAQLRPFAGDFFMAITKGTSYHFIEELQYQRIQHPVFPFDSDALFDAKMYLKKAEES